MASNHVQQSDHNGNMFGDGGHEPFPYNSIYAHAAPFNATWPVDPTLSDRSQTFQAAAAPPNPAYHPQPWQQHTATATPTSASSPGQHQSPYSAPRGYYPGQVPNAQTPFQSTSPYAGHGIAQYNHNQSLDPSLVGRPPPDNRSFPQAMPIFSSASPSNTISPAALHSAPPVQGNRQAVAASPVCISRSPSKHYELTGHLQMGIPIPEASKPVPANSFPQSQPQLQLPTAPKGTVSGNFVITDLDKLIESTQSVRLHNFINVGIQQYELQITKCKSRQICTCNISNRLTLVPATIPQYIPRKSQNELKALAALDPTLRGSSYDKPSSKMHSNSSTAKITKRVKKAKIIVPKPSRIKPVNGVQSGSKDSPISPPSQSDSSDYSSDDSDESDSEVAEPSPLPLTRPQAPIDAVRYDTMKSVWLPRNVYAPSESIRAGLKDFWEVIKTIRDRWKTDSDAVKQAAEAKKDSELPLLRERVDKQREMIEVALKAAIEYGHHDVLRAYVTPPPPLSVTISQCVFMYSTEGCLMCERCNQKWTSIDQNGLAQNCFPQYRLWESPNLIPYFAISRCASSIGSTVETFWSAMVVSTLAYVAMNGLKNTSAFLQDATCLWHVIKLSFIRLRAHKSRPFHINCAICLEQS
jgi:hypothetical protein